MKALLISPNVGGFYQDIIDELQRRGYETDYIWDACDDDDPDYLHSPHYGEGQKQKDKVLDKAKKYWENLLSLEEYNKDYDLLFVVDGKKLHPYLFQTLRSRKKGLKAINYLYDTTRGNYHFNVNSSFFDRVVTYDFEDSMTYGWDFIPIPWVSMPSSEHKKYVFYAMGSFVQSRFELYKLIDTISQSQGYDSFVKLYTKKINYYPIKYLLNILTKRRHLLSPSEYYSHFVTHNFIPKKIFQQAMLASDVIVDSINPNQDGLTARCTWALGAGKKIITNNASIRSYDFYTPEQILVVEDNDHTEEMKQTIIKFAMSSYTMPDNIREKVEAFRIDNWMSYMLQ